MCRRIIPARLNDIGYTFTTDGIIHNKVGGEILKNLALNFLFHINEKNTFK